MKEERSWLLRVGIPQLQQLAQETGTTVQVVDLFWGVAEDVALDPELYQVHMEQINYSRQYSAGPFFAVSHPFGAYDRGPTSRTNRRINNECSQDYDTCAV